MENRYCVIMCGGIGSRFWPFSKEDRPKQFVDFLGTGRSLLQMSYDRINGIVPPENIFVVTNERYAPLVKEQIPEMDGSRLLLEPDRRNTAPCIAWAAYHIHAFNPDASMIVMPSDHLILKQDNFKESVEKGFAFVSTHPSLLTMGIKPTHPETGYGYIQISKERIGEDFVKVKTFTEKPDLELAKVFVDSGEFFWNSGIFMWSANTIIKAMREYAPDIAMRFDKGEGIFATAGEKEFIAKEFPACPNISIDFAVMEKEKSVYVQCVDYGWSDLGSWSAFYEKSPKTEEGNVVRNCHTVIDDCENTIFASKGEKLIVAAGLKDYIIADSGDALLICPFKDEQRIRQYVNEVRTNFGEKYL